MKESSVWELSKVKVSRHGLMVGDIKVNGRQTSDMAKAR